MVEVTQGDREASAKWAKMQGRPQQAANMRRGSCDSAPLVQAFARHRIAAENVAQQEITALRARIAELEADRAKWVEVERLRMGKATPPTPPA